MAALLPGWSLPIPPIVTADGVTVAVGDRVFNYYDGRWGVITSISRVEPCTLKGQDSATPMEEWAAVWCRLDNGDFIDGSRMSSKEV